MQSKSDVQKLLSEANVDAVILTHLPNVRWATGFDGSNALLYVDADQRVLVTDSRYEEVAKRLSADSDFKVAIATRKRGMISSLKPYLKSITRIGYQADHTNVATAERIKEALPAPEFELVPLTGLLDRQIAVKTETEIVSITAAQQATEAAFKEIMDIIKPGVTEKAIAAELVYRQLQHGADGIAPEFWPVVAFGANSALPHAHAGDTKLQRGDAILLDFGCTVDGYCSDMTRTLVYGQPSAKFRTIYDTVLRAQKASLAIVQAGTPASVVDAAYRDPIEQAGYEVPHASHGVGLEIHEWPHISPSNTAPLPENAVVTIEPGIYLPGKFGVRIEDMVVVKKDGCRNLTTAPKELIVL